MAALRNYRPALSVSSYNLLLTLVRSALSAEPGNLDLSRVWVRLEDANLYQTKTTPFYRPSLTLTEFATTYNLVLGEMPPLESDDFDTYYHLFSSLRRIRAKQQA